MIWELADLKAEGKVLMALITGFWGLDAYGKTFTTLKQATGLSAPWLSKILHGLVAKGYVEHDKRFYRAKPEFVKEIGHMIMPFYGGYLVENARRVVNELRERFWHVEAVILFGSVAQGKADYDSDLDLLILLRPYSYDLSFRVYRFVNSCSLKVEVPIEPIPMAADDFMVIAKRELQFLFGILQGHIVLYDKGKWTEILRRKGEEIGERFDYVEEVPMWVIRRR